MLSVQNCGIYTPPSMCTRGVPVGLSNKTEYSHLHDTFSVQFRSICYICVRKSPSAPNDTFSRPLEVLSTTQFHLSQPSSKMVIRPGSDIRVYGMS